MPSVGHKLLSGASLRVVYFFTQLLVTFFLSPFVIHSLGDRLYGFWVLIGTFIGYYGLLDFGLTTAVNRYIAGALGSDDNREVKKVFNTAFPIFMGIGCVVLFVTSTVAFVAPWILSDPGEIPLFRSVILILGVSVAFDFLARIFIGTLQAQFNFHIIIYVQIVTLLVRSLLVFLALIVGYQILALAWITFLTGTVSNIAYYFYATKKMPALRFERKSFNRGMATRLFSYSFFTVISLAANQLRFHADAFVIASSLSLVSVTHYSIASNLIKYFHQFIGSVMAVFTPLFSRQEGLKTHDEIKGTLYFATKISVAISSFICFGMIAWGRPFIERWMGYNFLDAYPCLVVLALGILPFLCQTPAHSFLFATSKHQYLALLNSIEGVLNLALSFVLVRYYGILGVAMGTFFTISISKLVVFPVLFSRMSSFLYFEYMKNLLSYTVRCCMSLVVPWVITFFLVSADYIHLALVASLSALSYALSSWCVLLDRNDKNYFINSFLSIVDKA